MSIDPSVIALLYNIPFPVTATVSTSTGKGTASMGVSSGVVSSLTAVALTDPSVTKAGPAVTTGNFPFGFFNFKITGILVGQTVSVEFVAPSALPPGTVWVKIKPDGTILSITPTNLSGNVMTFPMTDGGASDDDGVANGVIVDQGGPGNPILGGIPEYPLEPVPVMALIGALMLFFLIRRRIR